MYRVVVLIVYMNIILLIANTGYQPVEYGTPKRLLTEAGHIVITASDGTNIATGKDGTTAAVELLAADITPEHADALYVIGGPGTLEHLDNEIVYGVLKRWQESGKPYGAICMAPRVLAHAGVLKGKRATGWNADNKLGELFPLYGVTYVPEHVVVDGNIVTADGPEAAEAFGRAILAQLA